MTGTRTHATAQRERGDAGSVLKALEGLAGVSLLDATSNCEYARLRDRPHTKRASRRRAASTAANA